MTSWVDDVAMHEHTHKDHYSHLYISMCKFRNHIL